MSVLSTGQEASTTGRTAPSATLTESETQFMQTSHSVETATPSINQSETRLPRITVQEAAYPSRRMSLTTTQSLPAAEAGSQSKLAPEASTYSSNGVVMWTSVVMVTFKSRPTNLFTTLTTINTRPFSSIFVTMTSQLSSSALSTQRRSAHTQKHSAKPRCTSTRVTNEPLVLYVMLCLQWVQ